MVPLWSDAQQIGLGRGPHCVDSGMKGFGLPAKIPVFLFWMLHSNSGAGGTTKM
jgi:hypothetical protein